ncbi:MAG: efflux RND transporter periplasmic adaptor subunit [Desulfobacterales bacterium]|nr:efflux RND transporter periplasmic adaptor subunit [Desulfobacterales bacterium]MDX2510814.1 efflux RND transporter periplasmic adaptor subunit [Desulfobacterales bacterium]
MYLFSRFFVRTLICVSLAILAGVNFISFSYAQEQKKTPPAVPVKVAPVLEKTVRDQISLVGTTKPIRESVVASEVSGLVEAFYVKAGDFIARGTPLAVLGSTGAQLRLKGAKAARAGIQAALVLAEKELQRIGNLKSTNSVAERQYDEAFYNHSALEKNLLMNAADIEQLDYEISKKSVQAPFAGFVALEHTQIGEWVDTGGPVVTLVDMNRILIVVDVPEKYMVGIKSSSNVRAVINSLGISPLSATVSTILPMGDPNARTFPVHIELSNKKFRIKSGMAATVTFSVGEKRTVMLLPKDAIVTSGNRRLVYTAAGGKAVPVPIKVVGYYEGNAAIQGALEPGQQVVVRGNERLRPGQAVQVID